MGKQDYYRQKSYDDAIDADQQDDDHLIEFQNLLFKELLYNIKKVPFNNIISNELIEDGTTFYGIIQRYSLNWLYTADRKRINDKNIYSFRFPSPCNPDYYRSFITKNHPYFALIKQLRHGFEEWYKYTGHELPETIKNYLNIAKVMNKRNSRQTKIFVNNKYERLDIEFNLRSDTNYERITITFEPGYPANS